ncbi:hypothetical protein DICVIV_06318 [Dictyocaulus viviparus]|uniref:Uncharacterized protein n=1 Tax=Dictyocaulus viviparus TaxID=29172 RepID=A0A0D8XZ29_DICVI|nr:hypothetical protein DICVIV_06318 [Dictyocaulus viviparus]
MTQERTCEYIGVVKESSGGVFVLRGRRELLGILWNEYETAPEQSIANVFDFDGKPWYMIIVGLEHSSSDDLKAAIASDSFRMSDLLYKTVLCSYRSL